MVRKIGLVVIAAAILLVVVWAHYRSDVKIAGLQVEFWYESLYTLLVLVGGVPVLVRYWRKRYFAVRTGVVMLVQLFFGYLFGYFLLPGSWRGVMGLGTTLFGPFLQYFWPLEINGVVVTKYIPQGSPLYPVAMGWMVYAVATSLVIMPLLVMRFGRAYCSWFCGCGALAETFGDPWRTQSPKGPKSSYYEWMLVPMVLFAVLATLSVIFGWGRTETGQTHLSLAYDLWAKFVLSGIVGLATYPLIGPRIWCRYFCPWAGLFGAIGKWGKSGIAANDLCMGCGMCNKHCHMGIDIRTNALKGDITKTTSCVYCGACVAVCPRRVLRIM